MEIPQAVVVIPYEGNESHDSIPSNDSHIDSSEGPILRLKALNAGWSKCLKRIEDILSRIYEPVKQELQDFIEECRYESEVFLPTCNIPTAIICSQDQNACSRVLDGIKAYSLPRNKGASFVEEDPHVLSDVIVRLSAKACSSVAVAVRAITKGATSQLGPDVQKIDGDPDIAGVENLRQLEQLYEILRQKAGGTSMGLVLLVLEDFEALDPQVVRDMIDLCCQHTPQIPFVFILSVSNPEYIYSTVPHSSLVNLRMRAFDVPHGKDLVNDIIEGVFFDPRFEPDVMIGPHNLRVLQEHLLYFDTPVAGLITSLQMMHIYHFSQPLSILAYGPMEKGCLGIEAKASAYLEYLKSSYSLDRDEDVEGTGDDDALSPQKQRVLQALCKDSLSALLALVIGARKDFYEYTAHMRTAIVLLRAIQKHLQDSGVLPLELKRDRLAFVLEALKAKTIHTHIQSLIAIIKNLQSVQLRKLLGTLHREYNDLPQKWAGKARPLHMAVVYLNGMDNLADGSQEVIAASNSFTECLVEYFSQRIRYLGDLHLSHAFCMGLTKDVYKQNFFNPSLSSALTTGLVEPSLYFRRWTDETEDNDRADRDLVGGRALLPDTSILFRRSLEGGKMINLYDWFESFTLAVEEDLKDEEVPNGDEMDVDPSLGDAREVLQARFLRAKQELEFVGLLKTTSRKVDHVIKVLFDLPDDS